MENRVYKVEFDEEAEWTFGTYSTDEVSKVLFRTEEDAKQAVLQMLMAGFERNHNAWEDVADSKEEAIEFWCDWHIAIYPMKIA